MLYVYFRSEHSYAKLTTRNGHFNIGSWGKKCPIVSQSNNVQLVSERNVLKKGVGMLATGDQGDGSGAFQNFRSQLARPLLN